MHLGFQLIDMSHVGIFFPILRNGATSKFTISLQSLFFKNGINYTK